MIQIIDYKLGNLRSVENSLKRLEIYYEIIDKPQKLGKDTKIIFPGVGAAGFAMENLKKIGFVDTIWNLKNPFLGICLGMQLLLQYSEENCTSCMDIIEQI